MTKNIVILLLTGAFAFYFIRSCKLASAAQEGEQAKKTLNDLVGPVEVKVDKSGATHYIINKNDPGQTYPEENKADPIYQTVKSIFDSAATKLEIKPGQITTISQISAIVKYDTVAYLERRIDSLEGKLRVQSTFRNKYLTLVSNSGDLKDSTDKGNFQYAYNAEINFVDYSKRKKVLWNTLPLGPKQYFTDISMTDTNATINGMRKYTRMQKEPVLGLRLDASVIYSPESGNFSMGPLARFDAGRWTFSGGYFWSTTRKSWTPIISVNRSLFRLQ